MRIAASRSASPSALRTLQTVVAAISLAALGVTSVHAAPVKSGDLVKSMVKATASIGKTVKGLGPGQLSPTNDRQKPFFAALKKTNASLASLSKAVAAKKDKAFFKSLDRTGKSIAELQRAVRLGAISDAKIAQGIKALNGAYGALSKNFGKAAQRRRKGGALAPQEVQQAAALKAKYQKALAQLQTVRSKPGKAPGVAAEVAGLIDSVSRLLSAGNTATLDWYVDLVLFEAEFTGSWYAVSSYVSIVDPGSYAVFDACNASFVDVYTYTETVEESFVYETAEFWSTYEEVTVETTESFDVAIADAEIATYEDYIEATDVDVTVDEFDVTVGDDDDAFLDHDDDGSLDAADADDDGDGTLDDRDTDDDGDGIADFAEDDSDDDGTPDALDDDDDNDGTDDGLDRDDDGDGTPDDKDVDVDNDDDGTPDARDLDDDNDGTPDTRDEDDDGDGLDDAADADDDNDGIDDGADADHDEDGDGTVDDADADDDNDGTLDEADADDGGEPDVEEEPEEEPEEEEPADDGGDEEPEDDGGDDGGDEEPEI
jgi:hypothetical protein